MSSVPNLDQDNALGGDEELSESLFNSGKTAKTSKKKSSATVYAIIGAGVLLLVYMLWTMFAPKAGGSSDDEMMIGSAAPQAAQRPTGLPQSNALPPAPGSNPTAPTSPAAAEATMASGLTDMGRQDSATPPVGQAVAQQVPGTAGEQLDARSQSSGADKSPSLATEPTAFDKAEMDALKARVASLEKSLQSLEHQVNDAQRKRAATTTESASKPKTRVAQTIKNTSSTAPKKQLAREEAAPKLSSAQNKNDAPRSGLHLKAVLDNRAWLQTASGATVTVAPGDEVRGYGVVKSIDVESGQVVLHDGTVIR